MQIVKPFAQYWENTDNQEHAIKCAQVCYASEKEITDKNKWLENKRKAGHNSIFRHQTYYLVIPCINVTERMRLFFMYNPYIGYYEDREWCYVSINGQTWNETPWFSFLFKYITNEKGLMNLAGENNCTREVENILRRTMYIVTQISTSRELNRVSPNNICEQSTRFCNYTADKFDGQVAICQPWWFDILYDFYNDKSIDKLIIEVKGNEILINKSINTEENKSKIKPISISDWGYSVVEPNYENFIQPYLKETFAATETYTEFIKGGMAPQNARGILPLDTATKCVYTYRIEEWKHILNLRYYGTAGKPHPNAKLIANLIRQELNNTIYFNFFSEHIYD